MNKVFSDPVVALSLLTDLVELLKPYRTLVLPLFFGIFFLLTFIAVAFYRSRRIRRVYVVWFFAMLVFFNTVSPVPLLPFVKWAHFAEPTPQTVEYEEIRIVDEHGHELKLDDRATLTFDAVTIDRLTAAILENPGSDRTDAAVRQLVLDSRDYRQSVVDPPWTHRIRFPGHSLTSTWTPTLLNDYGKFVGVRIYEMRFETSPDGTEIKAYNETLLFERYPFEPVPDVEPRPNESPPRSLNRTEPDATCAHSDLLPVGAIGQAAPNHERGPVASASRAGVDISWMPGGEAQKTSSRYFPALACPSGER